MDGWVDGWMDGQINEIGQQCIGDSYLFFKPCSSLHSGLLRNISYSLRLFSRVFSLRFCTKLQAPQSFVASFSFLFWFSNLQL